MAYRCPNNQNGLELRCQGGYLYKLLPNSQGMRQNTMERCPHCNNVGKDGGLKIPNELVPPLMKTLRKGK